MARALARFWSGTACRMTHYMPGVIFALTVFSQSVESCLPRSIEAWVPQDMMVGHVISKVNLAQCGTTGLELESDDSHFSIERDGTIVSRQPVSVPPQGRTFSIKVRDQRGLWWKTDVVLSLSAVKVGRREQRTGSHKRFKRRWSPLPFHVVEHTPPPYPQDIDLIGSDTSQNRKVFYELSGPGVTEDPKNVFAVESLTGMLRVLQPVDREQYPVIRFLARVFDQRTHLETDIPLNVTVNVLDINDNEPQFSAPLQFSVEEKSAPGTEVGKVIATDADEANTPHTKIKYTLLSGSDLFTINPGSGLILTKTPALDREVKDTHLVVVRIQDMDGDAKGLANSATATISLKDINDNPPTFLKKTHNAKIQENEGSDLVLRIPVDDKDLEQTPNWKAVYKITEGNENGNFRIETDPKTNEGLLYVDKPLDYEKTKDLKLKVVAENESPLVGSSGSWNSAIVDLSVEDVDEGPEFVPPNKELWVKESAATDTVIGTYTAIDPETSSSEGIRYYKVSDPASWFKVDPDTGDLKVANSLDHESEFAPSSTYKMTVKAVDASSKSSTGTVTIHLVDENDNVPVPLGKEMILCEKKGEQGSVLVVAEDRDGKPFSDPFTFELEGGYEKKWTLKRENGTAVWLHPVKELPTGNHEVPLVIKDQQDQGGVQIVNVRVCECRNGKCPAPTKSTALGVWGVLALLLGLALLLLLLLCCTMKCDKKSEAFHVMDSTDGGGMLLKSNTEAPGDAVTSDIMLMPSSPVEHSVKGSVMGDNLIGVANANTFGSGVPISTQQNIYQQNTDTMMSQNKGTFGRSTYGMTGSSSHLVEGHALKLVDQSAQTTWNTNGLFLHQKLEYFREQEDGRYADDLLHSYGFEGMGSPAGSVGCCSEQENKESLDFLNTLGPKFKTLAEVCGNK
ncbi:hypothetical protein GJAV_G00093490 [Gymnothorax javanicus]|nr:hypothetical protein GJAV_G00093490 [Gymnothorax javanicus]